MGKGKGKGWHGDKAGHARAARKGASKRVLKSIRPNSKLTKKQRKAVFREWW